MIPAKLNRWSNPPIYDDKRLIACEANSFSFANCPLISFSSGSSCLQRPQTFGQRVLNLHPFGGSDGLGTTHCISFEYRLKIDSILLTVA